MSYTCSNLETAPSFSCLFFIAIIFSVGKSLEELNGDAYTPLLRDSEEKARGAKCL
jgi:hypothetical protein